MRIHVFQQCNTIVPVYYLCAPSIQHYNLVCKCSGGDPAAIEQRISSLVTITEDLDLYSAIPTQ